MPNESAPDALQKGDRIELVEMGPNYDGTPDPDPMQPGAKGTVMNVVKMWDHGHHISVEWDPGVGRSLSLVVPPDKYRVIERVMD